MAEVINAIASVKHKYISRCWYDGIVLCPRGGLILVCIRGELLI